MAKHRRPQDDAAEVKRLKKKLATQKQEIDKAKKRLMLCLKDCMTKLEHPPWHYGPHCK